MLKKWGDEMVYGQPVVIQEKASTALKGYRHGEWAPWAFLVLHGFKGFSSWGFFPWLCDQLAGENTCSFRLDFSHNGIGEDPESFSRLDLFAKHLFSREIDEIKEAVSYLRNQKGVEQVILVGHSRGGGTALLAASEIEVEAVITLAGIDTVRRFDEATINHWKQEKVIYLHNGRTKQEMPMNIEILEEIENDPERYDILKRSQTFRVPTLHVHAKDDETVVLQAVHRLSQMTGGEVKILDSGGHTFNSGHPFNGSTPELDQVVEWIKDFCEDSLG